MKRQIIQILLSLVLITGILSACQSAAPTAAGIPAEVPQPQPDAAPAKEPAAAFAPTWQDGYAQLLRESDDKEFYLSDVDSDGIPELIVGGPVVEAGKYAEYNVYTYKDQVVESLGMVETLSASSLWLDNHGGILGYSYGAGAGGTHRYYIAAGALHFDGQIDGYYYVEENQIRWFRGRDGGEIIVTPETKYEYECLWQSKIKLEVHSITEEDIQAVIYGRQSE